MTDRDDMEAVVEAILFVANDPVPRDKLLEVFAQGEHEQAAAAVDAVVERYRGSASSGILIDEAGGGLRLVTRPDLHGWLRRFFEVSGRNKLSMAALESLAIVAYRQPITAPEISQLRGVASQGVLKTLLERRLVRIAGRKEVVGKPFLYATTREFLMHFGLARLQELPPLEQFEELFAGDAEADPDREVDPEEIADREAAEAVEAAADAERRLDDDELELERENNEARELPPDAAPPHDRAAEDETDDAAPASADETEFETTPTAADPAEPDVGTAAADPAGDIQEVTSDEP